MLLLVCTIITYSHLYFNIVESRRRTKIQKQAENDYLADIAKHLSHSYSTVLLQGESGTGKELVARALHAHSARRTAPFVAIHCGALSAELLESELFGHMKGSFTGAYRDQPGLVEAAHGGTLFLDEVGEMPPPMQVKLLRFLQEGTFVPVGGRVPKRADTRVVAATHRDLEAMVREGSFREDLYYRLNVLPIRVPPLRERRDDVPLLIEALCEDIAARGAGEQIDLLPCARALLAAQPWRGNIRELRNVLEQLALRSDSPQIAAPQVETVLRESGLDRIEPAVMPAPAQALAVGGADTRPLPAQIAELEQRAIAAALQRSGGNRAAAARLLGISRASLYDKLGASAGFADLSEI